MDQNIEDLWADAIWNYFTKLGNEVVQSSRCGDGPLCLVPGFLWLLGIAALSFQMVNALFRRFIFRRVPLWEVIVQDLVYIWMVLHGVQVWFFIVKLSKLIAEHYSVPEHSFSIEEIHEMYKIDTKLLQDIIVETEMNGNIQINVIKQFILWCIGATPLAVVSYSIVSPRPSAPLLVWIASTPFQRRELGTQGYYLNRPLNMVPTTSTNTTQPEPIRRSYSDSCLLSARKIPRLHKSRSC